MRFRPTYRNIWTVSYPLMVAGVSETIIDLTDTAFLAHYGMRELAAIGIADAVYGLALFMTLGLVDAIQILAGRSAGRAQPRELGQVVNQGLVLLLVCSALLIPLVLVLAPPALDRLLAEPLLGQTAFDYLRIAIFALLFHSFNLAISMLLIGISRTRLLIGASLILAATNVVLDSLLIFGHMGFPEMGIAGAATATLGAEAAAAVFLLAGLLRKGYPRRFGLFRPPFWQPGLPRQMLGLGLPVGLNSLVDTGKWFLLLLIIERLGEVQLAATNIALACYSLFLIPVDSISETVCAMTSNLIGQSRSRSLGLLVVRASRLSLAIVAPMLLLAALAPDALLSLFSEEAVLLSTAHAGLAALVLATLLAVPADAWYAAVLGTGDTRAGFAIQSFAVLAGLAWAAWAGLAGHWGAGVVLLSETVTWLACLVLSLAWIRGRRWQRLDF